jgi:hypothetical protein
MDNTTNTEKFNGNISEILDNIQKLQATEQNLINQLDSYTSASGYISSDPVIIELEKNINAIADSRIELFKTISTNAHILQTGVSQSRIDLVAQTTLLQVVEDQLNQAKKKIEQLHNRNDTKMRMVQINTYYGQRYEAQSVLMKRIILVCVPILCFVILKKKSFLPETIANYLIGISSAIGVFIIMINVWDIYTRSNMEFNEYEWRYESPDARTPTKWQFNKENFFNLNELFYDLMLSLGICVGKTCCAPGLSFDEDKQQCLEPPKPSSTTNSISAAKAATKTGFQNRNDASAFTSGKELKGTVIASYFNDDKHSQNGILPFSYDMAYAPI